MLRAEISLASTSVERTLEIIDNHGPRPRQATAAADLDRCSGSYWLPDGRLLHIQRDHDTLALVAPGQDALTLVPPASTSGRHSR
ncbi:MAG TPA: hypothetical protein VFA45_07960 [Actinomycetes bacterium]|jgi:hypothetical protein|nr:hypothetical protein [Actinomycetes bacterium]